MSQFEQENADPRPGSAGPGSGRVMAARKALEMQEKRKQARGSTREGMVMVSDINQGPRTPQTGSTRVLRRKDSQMDDGPAPANRFMSKQGSGFFEDQRMQEHDIGDGDVTGTRPVGNRFHVAKKPGEPGFYEQRAAMEQRQAAVVVESVVKPKPIQSRLHVSRGGADDDEEQAPPPQPRRAPMMQEPPQEKDPRGRFHNAKGQRWDEDDAPAPQVEVQEDTRQGRTHNSRRTLEEELDYEEPEEPPEESDAEKEAKRVAVLRELEEKEKAEISAEKQKALELERKRAEARKMKEAALAKEQAKAAAAQARQAPPKPAAPAEAPQGIYQGADALTPTADWDISADVEAFLFTPPPKGMTVQCRVEREKGLLSKMNQVYYLFLESNGQFLLAARKRSKKSKSANYLISLDKKDLARNGNSYVGKLRSNFIGTEFVFYDRGENPEVAFKNVPEGGEPDPNVAVRQELGGVIYASNILGWKGPRKMKIVIPAVVDADRRAIWQPMKPEESMVEKYKVNELEDLISLQNKSPVWNEETKSYVLNFHNRVKQASVKNFQVCFPDDTDTVLMQFGRVSGGVFSLDFSYPLSLFQAFCIALSSFDNKLACE